MGAEVLHKADLRAVRARACLCMCCALYADASACAGVRACLRACMHVRLSCAHMLACNKCKGSLVNP